MNRYFAALILSGIAGLAGCASTSETEGYQQYSAARDANKEARVGSRLVKPTTERMVSAVGNQEYSELNQHKAIANRFIQPK